MDYLVDQPNMKRFLISVSCEGGSVEAMQRINKFCEEYGLSILSVNIMQHPHFMEANPYHNRIIALVERIS